MIVKKTCRKRLTALRSTARRNNLEVCQQSARQRRGLRHFELSYQASPVILAVLEVVCGAQRVFGPSIRYSRRAWPDESFSMQLSWGQLGSRACVRLGKRGPPWIQLLSARVGVGECCRCAVVYG